MVADQGKGIILMITPLHNWIATITGLGEQLSAATLQDWQMEQVRETLTYARERGAFYRQHLRDIQPADIRSREDLAAIPFTTPEDIICHGPAMACVALKDISRITTHNTSGSSGSPKRIYFTENDLERTIDFFACGMSTMVRPGQSVLIMMSTPTEHSIADLLQRGLQRIGVEAPIHGNVRDVAAALTAARGYDCLVGVPAEILYLCRIDSSLRPETVLLSADYVPESVIQAITAAWGCRVLTHYGMTETGFGGGVQCGERRGYHLRDADLLLEIVDPETGRLLPAGQTGEVVLTTLRNEAMPLIRYRTGDIARLLEKPCSCGANLPQLDKVTGRWANTISLPNGGSISIHQLDEIMFAIPGLRGYQAQLPADGELVQTVDSQEPIHLDELAKDLPAGLPVQVRYGKVQPFTGAAKRQITR